MEKYQKISLFIVVLILGLSNIWGQKLPDLRVLTPEELPHFLTKKTREQLAIDGKISSTQLAVYFRDKFSERFYYDHKTFGHRFENYKSLYERQ